jgi:hypothetical protein
MATNSKDSDKPIKIILFVGIVIFITMAVIGMLN